MTTPAFSFAVEATAPGSQARAGRMTTPHGECLTPMFMPVGTQASVKALGPDDLLELGACCVLANTYHLYLRPGAHLIAELGGLHRFMRWQRPLLTDSGGFQVFSLSHNRKVTDDGVLFRSHLNGDPHFFSPENTVDIQLALGSDIMMMLDECLAYPAPREFALASMKRTVRWANAGYRHYLQRETGFDRALFPIVQGSMFPDLRRACAAELVELDAPGYAIGGLSVGEPRELSLEIAALTAPLLPAGRPRYVMGVGMPEELPQYVACGIDMMDCVLPTRNARNGYLFTSQGKVVIKQTRYQEDDGPLDPACPCYTCQTFSRAYLRHLFQAGEILFSMLATLHNIQYFLDIMRRMRQAILLGNFPAYLKSQGGWASARMEL